MTRLRRLLQLGDPATREPVPSREDVHQLRRRILTGLPAAPAAGRGRTFLIVTSVASALIVAGVVMVRRPAVRVQTPVTVAEPSEVAAPGSRKLVVVGPRGTRMIWLFRDAPEAR